MRDIELSYDYFDSNATEIDRRDHRECAKTISRGITRNALVIGRVEAAS